VHPISVEDLEATNLFVLIRHIWLMGEFASRRHEWGSEAVPGIEMPRAGDELIAALALKTVGTRFDNPSPTRQNPATAAGATTARKVPTAAVVAPSMMIRIRPSARTA
jgi:hypothetical protein